MRETTRRRLENVQTYVAQVQTQCPAPLIPAEFSTAGAFSLANPEVHQQYQTSRLQEA